MQTELRNLDVGIAQELDGEAEEVSGTMDLEVVLNNEDGIENKDKVTDEEAEDKEGENNKKNVN